MNKRLHRGWVQPEEESAVHLLRHLLRECTYLPDLAARAYLHPYILSRFREYHPTGRGGQTRLTPLKRRNDLMANGRKQLRLLQRANQGELRPLEKVLVITYGRLGKRRHELLAPLLQPGKPVQHPQDVGTVMGEYNLKGRKPSKRSPGFTTAEGLPGVRTLKTKDDVSTRARNEVGKANKNGERTDMVAQPKSPLPNKTIPQITPQLEALARSQRMVAPPEFTRTNPKDKDLAPQMPEKNVWARPLPSIRQVQVVKKWYANLLEHILPPVSETEWARLRDLASGKLEWKGLRPRRPAARPLSVTTEEKEHVVDTTRRTVLNKDQRVREDRQGLMPYAQSARFALTTEIGVTKPTKDTGERISGHHITGRFMRRLWGKIFAQCPMMTWDSAKKEWQVVWGYTDVISSSDVPSVHSVDMALFAGVNEEGERLELTTEAERRAV